MINSTVVVIRDRGVSLFPRPVTRAGRIVERFCDGEDVTAAATNKHGRRPTVFRVQNKSKDDRVARQDFGMRADHARARADEKVVRSEQAEARDRQNSSGSAGRDGAEDDTWLSVRSTPKSPDSSGRGEAGGCADSRRHLRQMEGARSQAQVGSRARQGARHRRTVVNFQGGGDMNRARRMRCRAGLRPTRR